MAACEAVVETKWGDSRLYKRYRNVFGQKASHPPLPYETVSLPTGEFLSRGHVQTQVMADFVIFPTAAEAFEARMNLLLRLAPTYPSYYAALHAADPLDFVMQVSKTWSTAPNRAANCIEIFKAHQDILSGVTA
jgi:flagellum-specific peptidoglycan hydrolase FlgJ